MILARMHAVFNLRESKPPEFVREPLKHSAIVPVTLMVLLATGITFAALTRLHAQPTISVQPMDQFVDLGRNASFTVSSPSAPPVTYQWVFNGLELSNATNRTLTLISAQPAVTGDYFVVVSNASGSVTSQVVRLKVFVAATHGFSNISLTTNRSVALGLAGETAALFGRYYDLYRLEVSSNLTEWTPLVTITRTNSSTNSLTLIDRGAAELNSRFYRTATNLSVTPLPPLTGPYDVGTVSRLMTDPSRTNNLRRTNHQFMVTFWYPAIRPASVAPAAYMERQVIGPYATFVGYSALNSVGPAFVGHSLSNAPVATNQLKWPVVLYSPSLNSHRRENVYKVEELASHGFVVAGLDHRATFASVFPDGRIVNGQSEYSSTLQGLFAGIQVRSADEKFVMDELGRMNDGDPLFAKRLDLEHIGAFGFSFGGATAAETCRTDSRCKAGINMDGGFFNTNLLQTPLTTPFMMLRSDTLDAGPGEIPGWTEDRRLVIEKMARDRYFVQTSGTVHWSYSDMPLIAATSAFASGFGGGERHPLIPNVRINQIASAYVVSFFKKYLKDEDDHLLDGPPAEFPEVIEFFK